MTTYIVLAQKKESSTRRTLHADVNTRKGANGELFIDNSISQKNDSVNTQFSFAEGNDGTRAINERGAVGLYRITVEEVFQSKTNPNDLRFHNLKYIEKVADDIGDLTRDINHGAEKSSWASTAIPL